MCVWIRSRLFTKFRKDNSKSRVRKNLSDRLQRDVKCAISQELYAHKTVDSIKRSANICRPTVALMFKNIDLLQKQQAICPSNGNVHKRKRGVFINFERVAQTLLREALTNNSKDLLKSLQIKSSKKVSNIEMMIAEMKLMKDLSVLRNPRLSPFFKDNNGANSHSICSTLHPDVAILRKSVFDVMKSRFC